MSDATIRQAQREGRWADAYRLALRAGVRRPWSPRQIRAAREVLAPRGTDREAVLILTGWADALQEEYRRRGHPRADEAWRSCPTLGADVPPAYRRWLRRKSRRSKSRARLEAWALRVVAEVG